MYYNSYRHLTLKCPSNSTCPDSVNLMLDRPQCHDHDHNDILVLFKYKYAIVKPKILNCEASNQLVEPQNMHYAGLLLCQATILSI